MNVDRRLHRAARELRGVDVAVPPIATSSARRGSRPLLAVAASILVLAGAAAVVVPMTGPGDTERPSGEAAEDTSTLHPLDEIALIDDLTGERGSPATVPVRPVPPGVI